MSQSQAREDQVLTKEAALACCAKWQARLRLLDWQILLDIKRSRDLELEGKEATISRLYPNRIAWITLMDPVDYPEGCALPQDHEVNIVHELLHIMTGYFDLPNEGPMHIWEEQAITAISQALVALDREGKSG